MAQRAHATPRNCSAIALSLCALSRHKTFVSFARATLPKISIAQWKRKTKPGSLAPYLSFFLSLFLSRVGPIQVRRRTFDRKRATRKDTLRRSPHCYFQPSQSRARERASPHCEKMYAENATIPLMRSRKVFISLPRVYLRN